jgi:hypothetical protein
VRWLLVRSIDWSFNWSSADWGPLRHGGLVAAERRLEQAVPVSPASPRAAVGNQPSLGWTFFVLP